MNDRVFVRNDPVNWVDPDGRFAFIPVIAYALAGYGVLTGADLAVERHYQYELTKQLDREIQFTKQLLEETDSKDCERYQLLKQRLDKLVLQQTNIFLTVGVESMADIYSRVPDLTSRR